MAVRMAVSYRRSELRTFPVQTMGAKYSTFTSRNLDVENVMVLSMCQGTYLSSAYCGHHLSFSYQVIGRYWVSDYDAANIFIKASRSC